MDQPSSNGALGGLGRPIDVKTMIGTGAIYGAHIACPVCRFEYTHPVAVVVNAGGSITTVDKGGTRMSAGKPVDRGVMIEIHFVGECGHDYRLNFHFHKGITSVESTIGGGTPDDRQPPATIWRD
jgi:hypothetical protein